MKQGHTPTPWEIVQNGNGHWAIVAGEDRLGDYIATVEGEADDVDSSRLLMAINAANAALIVRAVNAHDDLVKVLKAINDFWSDVAENQKSGACLSPSALLLDDDTPIAVAVSAALAKARGE